MIVHNREAAAELTRLCNAIKYGEVAKKDTHVLRGQLGKLASDLAMEGWSIEHILRHDLFYVYKIHSFSDRPEL